MSENKNKIMIEMYKKAHKPCVKCDKSGVMSNTHEYVCGASLKKYSSCKHKEHIRNIHNVYFEALIKAYEENKE